MPNDIAHESAFDDRVPYEVAAAVVGTIAELSDHLTDEQAVLESFSRWRGGYLMDYIDAIRNTRHSVFYYQIQHLYEFAIESVASQFREDFCFLAGRHFLQSVLAETIFPLLQVGMAKPGSFQSTVVEMIRMYAHRFGGNKYLLTHRIEPDEIVLTVEDRAPEKVRHYLEQYGLNGDRCFRNSMHFIAGGVHEFVTQIAKDFESAAFPCQVSGNRGVIRLPLTENNAFAFERLIETLLRFIHQIQARQRLQVEEQQFESDLILNSPVMMQTWNRIRRASLSDEIVLLLGESGTGKTFIAHKIHALSQRKDGPMIPVCLTSDVGSENLIQSNLFGHEKGAFTGATEQKQGLFSLANGGTIFLDEIGDASPELQAKLLRVIETSTFKRLGGVKDIKVDVRVIAATHRNLEKMVEEGKFRQDLFYRLHVIPISVPPLRDRADSIPALVQYFLRKLNRASRDVPREIATDMLELLKRYAWPGNVRELEHALKHAYAMAEGTQIQLNDFPEKIQRALGEIPVATLSSTGAHEVINTGVLRQLIRSTDPKAVRDAKHLVPCHIEYAKRNYLGLLIEELNGDLSAIGQFWDHHSEKTLRNLINEYGLGNLLQTSREKTKKTAVKVSF